MAEFNQVGDEIARCIAIVRRRAANHPDEFDRNETATRVQLIDPMLRALGWDVEDPNAVKHEYRIGSGRLDYALFVSGKMVAIVEAKSLSKSSEALPQGQLMKYARDPVCEHLKAVAVTNGVAWVVHRESNQWTQERTDLSDGETFKAAFEAFGLMHQSHFEHITESPAIRGGSEARSSSRAIRVSKAQPRPVRVGSGNRRRPTRSDMLDLSDPTFKANRHAPPRLVIDHLGAEHETNHWIDLLVVVANALIDEKQITKAHCPIKKAENRDVHLINTLPFHTNGRRFHSPKQISGGYFLEANLYVRDCYRNARHLLRFANIPLTAVKFSVEQFAIRTTSHAPTGWSALSDRSLDAVVSGKRPPTIFSDHLGESHRVRSWADFYRTAINALIDDQRITARDCPIKRKPHLTKCLISDSPYHPNGRPIKVLKELHGGMFLEGDFGAIDFIRNLRVLLRHANLPLDSIKFRYGPE